MLIKRIFICSNKWKE